MKKWMWVLVAVIIAVGVGGYSYTRYRLQEQSYTTEMKAGKEALQSKDYAQAETNFTHASRTKANDTAAQRYLTQTQTYVGGNDSLKSRQFSAAKSAFTSVKNTSNASSVLVTRSQDQLALIKKVTKQRKTYTSQYQKALELNKANEFTDSNGVIAVMLQSKTFKQAYYGDIYKQVTALRKQNNASIKALTGSTPITNSAQTATSSDASSNSDSSSSTSRGASQANGNSKTSSSINSVSGNYSDAQLQATRAELNEAGMNGSNYSDSQIEAILKRASTEHISIAQAAKTGSYSADQIQATRAELDQAGMNSNNYTDAQIEAVLQQAAAQHMSIAQAAKSLQ
ncbi:cell surface protein [Lactiplantibacillus carotarum]|uniref:cell surface protein n=1 Tax=Lactiplantibacillus carotarum TaxID=2993456 RepID=UPI00298F1912|nr:cell surface protein [Lactiplantibacillus carotarum]